MPQVRTISLLFWRDLGGRFPGRHRIAPHRVFKSGRRENESHPNRLRANVLRTYPSVSRNKHKRPRMEIALALPKPNVSLAALNQQDFILGQVSVFRYGRSWCKLLPARYKMLRTVVFRTDFQYELGGRGDTGVSVNPASPQLAFILLQQEWLGVGLWTWSCAGLI